MPELTYCSLSVILKLAFGGAVFTFPVESISWDCKIFHYLSSYIESIVKPSRIIFLIEQDFRAKFVLVLARNQYLQPMIHSKIHVRRQPPKQ
jgi:hypothetical protein